MLHQTDTLTTSVFYVCPTLCAKKGYKKMLCIIQANPLLLFKTSGEYANSKDLPLSDDIKVVQEISSREKRSNMIALLRDVFTEHLDTSTTF